MTRCSILGIEVKAWSSFSHFLKTKYGWLTFKHAFHSLSGVRKLFLLQFCRACPLSSSPFTHSVNCDKVLIGNFHDNLCFKYMGTNNWSNFGSVNFRNKWLKDGSFCTPWEGGGDGSGRSPVWKPATQNEHLDRLLYEKKRTFRVELWL